MKASTMSQIIRKNRKNEDEVRKANVVEFDEPFFDNKMHCR